jgi:serine/threonine protein phosphatase PrpC
VTSSDFTSQAEADPAVAVGPSGESDDWARSVAGSNGEPVVAAITNRGLRHRRNEDGVAVVVVGGWRAAVVADGVSSTANPNLASSAAVSGAAEVLQRRLSAFEVRGTAMPAVSGIELTGQGGETGAGAEPAGSAAEPAGERAGAAAEPAGERAGAAAEPAGERAEAAGSGAGRAGVGGHPAEEFEMAQNAPSREGDGRAARRGAEDQGGTGQGEGPPDPVDVAVTEALAAAWRMVAEVPRDEPGGYSEPPSTTVVLAVVDPEGRVTLASIGDSRAYWVSPTAAALLSTDDSWAEQAIATGVAPSAAYRSPMAHVITRWVDGAGADRKQELQLVHHAAPGPGFLVLCSDGLWNYFGDLDRFAGLVLGDGTDESAVDRARRMVDAALQAGGGDNITVAVLPIERRIGGTDDG